MAQQNGVTTHLFSEAHSLVSGGQNGVQLYLSLETWNVSLQIWHLFLKVSPVAAW